MVVFFSFSFLQKVLIQFAEFNNLLSFHFTSGLQLLAHDELVQSKPCLVYKYECNKHLTAAYNKQLLLLQTYQYLLHCAVKHSLLLF